MSTSPLTLVGEQPREAEAGTPCSTLAEAYQSCHLSAPLLVGTSVIGELCISSLVPRRYTERHRELLASLADMAAIAVNNARLLERERQMAVLEERDRLAREMHDSLAQVLGYIHLGAQTAKRTLARQDVTRAEQELDDIASIAYEAYKDVREAILGLRETVSTSAGVLGTLREYLQKFSRQASVTVELVAEEDEPLQLSPEVEVQLIRVIQEGLTNVRKHANADKAWVRIRRRNGEVNINIEDNGQGFDPALVRANGHRFGVRIMQERVETVGGRFDIESSPGGGTKVQIYLPAAQANNHGSS
jgi:signal transduction histidine kinase